MGTPPVILAGRKTRIVLSVLAWGGVSIADAARKGKVSEQSIGRWKADSSRGARSLRQRVVAVPSGSSRSSSCTRG